jgi:thiazolinyl imide reductase
MPISTASVCFPRNNQVSKKYRLVVCGTTFGQVYLSLFLRKNPHFRLAGILAKGSPRSRQYAKEFGVPLYNHVSEVPCDIDIACVVVRAAIAKGEGTFIAEQFLKRGIHVIQEHPVHARDITRCLDAAAANNVCYHVNSHYVHLESVRTFIDYLDNARRHRPLVFVDAAASLQTLYSLFDIIGCAVGGIRPFALGRPVEQPLEMTASSNLDFVPFSCLQGVVCGAPMTLRIQNYHDPCAFDNHFLIMHRVSVGTDAGNLTLVNTHGPVVWSQSFSILEKDDSACPFRKRKTAFSDYTAPTAVTFTEPNADSLFGIAARAWPGAIQNALSAMKQHIETGVSPFNQTREYLLGLSEVWLETTRRIGKPCAMTITPAEPPIPDPESYGADRIALHSGKDASPSGLRNMDRTCMSSASSGASSGTLPSQSSNGTPKCNPR